MSSQNYASDAWILTATAPSCADMVTFMPFASFMYFTCIGTMEGRPWDEIYHRWRTVGNHHLFDRQCLLTRCYKQNFPTLIKNQYMFFAPAQIINMAILPLYARPPFINTVGLFWTLVSLHWLLCPEGRILDSNALSLYAVPCKCQ